MSDTEIVSGRATITNKTSGERQLVHQFGEINENEMVIEVGATYYPGDNNTMSFIQLSGNSGGIVLATFTNGKICGTI